jgi:adenylate cyclase
VGAGRLTLLPVERSIAGDGQRYSPREIAELSGADLDLLQRASAALGLPYPDPDERILTDSDLEAARRTKAFYDAGLPEDGILQVARTIGMATARIAEGNRELMIRTLMQPGDTERDLALRFADAAENMLPVFEPTLIYALRAHTLEQIRRDVIGAADLASGEIRGSVDRAVCFADLVEFTRLGEEIAPEELGSDAAMLVSREVEPLLDAALELIEVAEGEGEEFPFLRAGLAVGPTLAQSGDYYGRAVNLASRLTAVARPGSVLVDAAAKEAAGDDFSYSFAGERKLKGIDSGVKLFRVRREPKKR